MSAMRHLHKNAAAILGAALLLAVAPAGHAADKIRVAKAIDVLWVYTALDVGVEEGIFAKYGLDLDISVMPGDAKLQQALIADSIDIGLAGGPSMALSVKGSPAMAVAAYAGPPRNFSVILVADSPIKTVADLKGKTLATATSGSLPEWLIKRVSIAEGWGPTGIKTTASGGFEASMAATLNHSVDGFMGATEAGLLLEEQKRGRILTGAEKYAPHFVSQVITTRQPYIKEHPELVERFLKGMFASIAFVKANKDKSTAIAQRVLHQSPTVMSKVYDAEVGMLSDDGTFDPDGMNVLKDSFTDLGILPKRPSDNQLFTTQFLPVKP